jgi:hypothetical protein
MVVEECPKSFFSGIGEGGGLLTLMVLYIGLR